MLSILTSVLLAFAIPSIAASDHEQQSNHNKDRSNDRTFLVGIAGGSASGKTTLAQLLTEAYREEGVSACYVSMDWYYRPAADPMFDGMTSINFDHPDSQDLTLVMRQLQELKEGRFVEAPKYSYALSDRLPGTQKVGPCEIVFFEGIFSLYDEQIRSVFDYRIFVSLDGKVRRERRITRDQLSRSRTKEEIEKQYDDVVTPMFEKFAAPTVPFATEVVDGGKIFEIWEEIKSRIGQTFGL